MPCDASFSDVPHGPDGHPSVTPFSERRAPAWSSTDHTSPPRCLPIDGRGPGGVRTAVACGGNSYGQCRLPALEEGLVDSDVAARANHTVLLKSDGTAVACGRNSDGRCSLPALEEATSFSIATRALSHRCVHHAARAKSDRCPPCWLRFSPEINLSEKSSRYCQLCDLLQFLWPLRTSTMRRPELCEFWAEAALALHHR